MESRCGQSNSFESKYRQLIWLFKLFCIDNIAYLGKTMRIMIVDMEVKSAAENISKRAGYLWRFL